MCFQRFFLHFCERAFEKYTRHARRINTRHSTREQKGKERQHDSPTMTENSNGRNLCPPPPALEFREISFGYTGGVFYPFERGPFRDFSSSNGESVFPRAKRRLVPSHSPSSEANDATTVAVVRAHGRPVVVSRCPEDEEEDIKSARARRMIRAQNVHSVKETNRVKREERYKLPDARSREENQFRHVVAGIPVECLRTIERAENEEEMERARTRREDAANCLKIFRDGTVVTRDAKGRAVSVYSDGIREMVERENAYQRTFDVQGIEEEDGRGQMKMVATRDFCGVSVSKTNESGRTFRREFSTTPMIDRRNDVAALPTDMSFTNQSACENFADCCLRVATEAGTVQTYRPGERGWVKWDTVSIGVNSDSAAVVRQWYGCYEATHPRTMLHCNSNRVQVIDERRPEVANTRGAVGTSITAGTSSSTRDERIQCASNILTGTFLFAVGTRNSVKLYDVRKYSPIDPVFSWKHGMASSPSSVEVRDDFRMAFDANVNIDDSYVTILAVANETGDAMAFETKGVNNTQSQSFTMSALSAGVRLVPRSADPPWGGFQFYPGQAREKEILPFFAWSEEATGTVYVQNFEDVETTAKDVTRGLANSNLPLSFGHMRRKMHESFDAHSHGKVRRREPFDISRQLDEDEELLPYVYNGSSKHVAIDAAWKREEENNAEEEDEDAYVARGAQMIRKAAEAFDLAKKLKMDEDLRELRKHGKIQTLEDDGWNEVRQGKGQGHVYRLNAETGVNEMIFGGNMSVCPIFDDNGEQCEFACNITNRIEAMRTHLWESHKIKSRPFSELVRAGEAKSRTKILNWNSKQKTITAPMSYNFISLVGEEGDSADYPKHIQSKRDERNEYWETINRRAKENLRDEGVLRQAVNKIKSIEMERYKSIDSADVMKRLRNLRENGWGTTLVIDDEDEDEDDDETRQIELMIGNLDYRRPREGGAARKTKPTLTFPPLSPGEEDLPRKKKKSNTKKTEEKVKPPSVNATAKEMQVDLPRAVPVMSQSPFPVPEKVSRPKKTFAAEKKKEKKRDKKEEKKKKKKKKIAGFL